MSDQQPHQSHPYSCGLHYNQILHILSFLELEHSNFVYPKPQDLYGYFAADPERMIYRIIGINQTIRCDYPGEQLPMMQKVQKAKLIINSHNAFQVHQFIQAAKRVKQLHIVLRCYKLDYQAHILRTTCWPKNISFSVEAIIIRPADLEKMNMLREWASLDAVKAVIINLNSISTQHVQVDLMNVVKKMREDGTDFKLGIKGVGCRELPDFWNIVGPYVTELCIYNDMPDANIDYITTTILPSCQFDKNVGQVVKSFDRQLMLNLLVAQELNKSELKYLQLLPSTIKIHTPTFDYYDDDDENINKEEDREFKFYALTNMLSVANVKKLVIIRSQFRAIRMEQTKESINQIMRNRADNQLLVNYSGFCRFVSHKGYILDLNRRSHGSQYQKTKLLCDFISLLDHANHAADSL